MNDIEEFAEVDFEMGSAMSPRQDCKFSLEHLQSGALFLQPRSGFPPRNSQL
jgi:hypothetical protein